MDGYPVPEHINLGKEGCALTKCKRHSYIWIPRSAATFENMKTGELIAFDLGICQKCGHYKPRIHVWGFGDQLEAQIWGEKRFEVKKVKEE